VVASEQNVRQVLQALAEIQNGMEKLRSLGVIRSQKVVGDLGEWLVAQVFGGEIAASKGNADWDVIADGERIQVKAHAKAADNSTRWTGFPKPPAGVDAIAVVVFSPAFRVLELYKVPAEELGRLLRASGDKLRLPWDDLGDWRVSKAMLPASSPLCEMFE